MLKNKKIIIGALVLLVVVLVGYLAFQRFLAKPTFKGTAKIGYLGPLSGENASVGLSLLKGAELAKKELGADNIEIVTEDSLCSKDKAPEALKTLIEKGVVAVIGELCSGASVAALPLANQNKIVLISAGSTSPKLSIEGDFFFRTVPPDSLQGQFAAQLVSKKGLKNLAILYTNEEYGIAFADILKENFEKAGGKVVASVSFERNALDLRNQLNQIKKASPEAIYIISNSLTSSVAALTQIKELSIKATILGSEGLQEQQIINDAGEAAEGLIVTAVGSGTKAFKQSHKAEFGVEAGLFAAQGYDAFKALYLALSKGGKTGEEIKNTLPEVEFDGVSGHIKFDKFGEVSGNYDVLIVEDRKFVPVTE